MSVLRRVNLLTSSKVSWRLVLFIDKMTQVSLVRVIGKIIVVNLSSSFAICSETGNLHCSLSKIVSFFFASETLVVSLFFVKAGPSSGNRRKRAWSESDEDEPQDQRPESSLVRENSAEMQESDGEIKDDNDKPNGDAAEDDED